MGGGISSNLHAVFFEIDDVITPASDGKNNLEVNLGNISGKDSAKVGGCLVTEGKFSGGDSHIRLPGFKIDSKCSNEGIEKILDNENYFSTCFLVPKNLKIKDDGGTDISDKCKLVYKTELKCEGDDTEDTEDTEETTEESFTNFKNDNDKSCIFLAAIIVVVYLYIKRKN